jgi:hypothetical protein
MPAGLEEAGSLRRGNLRYFPVIPGRLEFTVELRRALLEDRPAVVAVELPSALRDDYLAAVARLPQFSVLVYPEQEEDDRAVYIPVEPCDPFTEAIRTGLEIGAEIVLLEPATGARPHLPDSYPDSYSLRYIGAEKFIEAYRVYPQPRNDDIQRHAEAMAWKLQGADPLAASFVVVSLNMLDPLLDAMQQPQDSPPRRKSQLEVERVNPHPDCLAEILAEYPYLQERYERYRQEMADDKLVDRRLSNAELLRDAEKQYKENTGDKIEQWQRRNLARYLRNLAAMNNELVVGLFDLTVAARSIVDDNYAWEVWDLANRYPSQKAESDWTTVSISGEEMWLNSRRIRLRRRLPRPKQLLRPRGLKNRKQEKKPGEWAEELNGNSICSYPPEDLLIEDYGRFLKQRAKSMLSAERSRTQEFTTSLLDGIDLRETIRNWHEGKIYVREFSKLAGEVGSVVVIFDEDGGNRYAYTTTWLGENQNESDMAFYSTMPFEHMVGPGIGRAEYGGFLMTLPPRRMFDVWSDPDYDLAETKSEVLLLAGLDYSVERHVVYVAAKPPRSIFRNIAGRMGRSILYVPIGSLSPAKMKKLRVVHVLDSHTRRDTAKEFIW